MERRLYWICNEFDITYITIAHRPALRAYHSKMLSIGDGAQVRETLGFGRIVALHHRSSAPHQIY
jgi:ABC-type uncharacterized transport system fused permease/ATPase subunit